MSHTWELFYKAAGILATGQGSIKARLEDAFVYELNIVEADDSALPPDLQHEFSNLQDEVTSAKPVGDEGGISASIQRMSEERATNCSQDIRYLCRTQQPKVTAAALISL